MSTAIKSKFNVDKIETSESLKLGGTTVTSFIDSGTVTSIGTSSSVSLSIVQNAGNPSAKIYDSAELLPGSADSGSMALVTETNRLYIWNGTGWYNIALVNTSPTLSTTPDSNYTMDSTGASLTVTIVASDPEELPITYSYLSDSASNFVSITQDSGVFTISSLTQAQLDSNGVSSGGTFSITFRATDGVNIAPAVSSFTLTLAVTYDWSTTSQSNKITASDAANNDFFGNVVDIDGDYAVVGARTNKAAYIYKASDLSWAYGQQQANFQPADVGGSDFYGDVLEISNDGNTIAVGCRGEYAIYIHTRSGSTWSQQQKIEITGVSGYIGRQGVALSGDGDTLAFSDSTFDGIGRVYVWTRSGSTWSSERVIEYTDADSDLDSSDRFGSSLSLTDNGNTLVIGCFKEDQDGSNTGGVYVFTRSGSTWSFQQRLQSNPVIASSEFSNQRHGVGISGDGNYIVVGAGSSNKSHVFNLSGGTWSQQAILTPSGGTPGTNAPSVDISQNGDTVIVGVPLSDGEASNAGAAYVFTRSSSTWSQQARLNHSTAAASDFFGWDVGISNDGNTAIVSAYADDISSSTDAGSAFIFTRSGSTWTEQKELNQSTVYAESYFGHQSRISGDATTAIVSANGYDTGSAPYDVGMVYIYEQGRQWSEQQKIQETTFGSNFGHAVSISGDTVVVGSHNEDVNSADGTKAYVYTRAGYSLANASYASKTYSFTSVENSPTGFEFNSDGTKLIIVGWQQLISGTGTGGCYQYSLSTAYDVSTASYDSVSFDLSNEMTQPTGMKFSSDGTKMFVIDNQAGGVGTGDVVFQYNLSTAYDISSASYSNNSLNVNSYETVLAGIDFKPDGTKMFLNGAGSDAVRAWDLSSAWDLSTASYASETYSLSSQETSCTGVTFNGDGTKMYITGYQSDAIYQYSLSTAWDVSSASYDSVSLSVSSQDGQPRQIRFNSDGSKLWMIGTSTDSIYEYSVPESWSLQQKVDPSQAEQSDYFGYQRTMKLDKSNNNQFIAGAYSEDESYSAEGAVYIFTRSGSTWSEQQRIIPSDAAINANYGVTVDIAGDYAVFGGRPGNNFAVYVWTRSGSTWSQQTTLTQPSGHTNSQFAYASGLSINNAGDTVAVGAYGNSSTQAGKVFIYTRSGSTWTNEAVIQPSDSANGDFFGWECRLDSTGDILVVGAKTAGTGGKAYVFTRSGSTWTQQANVTASDVASNWEFGEDVGISAEDGRIIVGARQYSSSASGQGAAYIFTASEA